MGHLEKINLTPPPDATELPKLRLARDQAQGTVEMLGVQHAQLLSCCHYDVRGGSAEKLAELEQKESAAKAALAEAEKALAAAELLDGFRSSGRMGEFILKLFASHDMLAAEHGALVRKHALAEARIKALEEAVARLTGTPGTPPHPPVL